MHPSLLLRRVNLLEGAGRPPRRVDVRIRGGVLERIEGEEARPEPRSAAESGERVVEAERCWLGPALVDPHSVLEDPFRGRAETLPSLCAAAAEGGYGTVALLPWASAWRDRPERLTVPAGDPLRLLLWGSFSLEGAGRELAPHADQLESGAVGLAEGEATPPLALLERGLRLGEMGERPVLVAPRDPAIAPHGFVRERVEALRAGLPTDPAVSETLPLQALLTLAEVLPDRALRLMNLSTAEGVALLRRAPRPARSSVCWWHLVADSGSLAPTEEGWRVLPPLGASNDREALVEALAEGLIDAVAVHHVALDPEERLLPLDQRRPGVAGHGLVLPLLWGELVRRRGWPVERLWQALCWGPASFLGIAAPELREGSRDWVLFDPEERWLRKAATSSSLAANQPLGGREVRGRVVASGLIDPGRWPLRGSPSG